MHRLGPGARGDLEQPLLVEVALGRRPRPDEVRLVGDADVQRAAVGLGVDGDGADPELAQGPEDADGDLAAVRHEDFREDGHRRAYSPCA